jgi:hypothetical protein
MRSSITHRLRSLFGRRALQVLLILILAEFVWSAPALLQWGDEDGLYWGIWLLGHPMGTLLSRSIMATWPFLDSWLLTHRVKGILLCYIVPQLLLYAIVVWYLKPWIDCWGRTRPGTDDKRVG